jgi:hypothetical protein
LLTALTLTSSNPARWVPPVAVGYQELLSHREVTLYYPGSQVLNFGGHGEYPERCQATISLMCAPADVPASIYTILTADAAASADVFLWYREQLGRRGWRPGYSNAEQTRAYERAPGERFQLIVETPEASRELLGGTEPRIYYQTSYSLATCPSIDAGCRSSLVPVASTTDHPDTEFYFPPSVWLGSEGSPVRIRAYLVALGGSRDAVVAWYDHTLSSNGWSKGPSLPLILDYRRGSQNLVVTFTSSPVPIGYAVAGESYTVLYRVDTCAGQPESVCR